MSSRDPHADEDRHRHERADAATRRDYLRQYRELIWPFRWAVVRLMAVGMVAGTLEMLSPAVFGVIINLLDRGSLPPVLAWMAPAELARPDRMFWLAVICGGMVGLILLARGLEVYRNINTIATNQTMITRLRRRLHRHLLHLSLSNLYSMKTGMIVSRLSGDVDRATGLLQQAVMSPAQAVFRIIIGSVLMFAWNWKLALAAWVVLPVMLYISLMWVRRIRPIFRSAGRDRNIIDARATETFGGIRVVRAFQRENRERVDYTTADNTMIRKRLFARKTALTIDSLWQALIPLSSIALGGVGGWLYLNEQASLGQIAAFQFYVPMLLGPVFRIVATMNQTQESLAAMERVFEVFQLPVDKPDPPGAVDAPRRVERFEFDGVSFAYTPGVPVIRHFNLHVRGGTVVALVGPSGAGKTTVTDLIARFYDPTDGVIRLNGIDLRRIRLQSYRRLLAVVPQEVFLFDGTVRQNIAYSRKDASDNLILDAAERANAMRFIRELPEGFDTVIGERGVKLSGGQRQRIAIARAILADPQILILDEATSNLDTESEQLIQSALEDLYENRTTFVIAHRLSTVTHADNIVVIDHGRVVETGTHEDLMAGEGMYHDMIERQRQFATEGDLP
ncbi:MAG: ATP-binding cassette domain-containing protein [Planctomycetes bacterium]|nr:ATP-binding cassette domain-containing protein [Planctomycetota bacterium]